MPAKHGLSSEGARQREAKREIRTFLKAMHSYAERLRQQPNLSFQEHFSSMYRMPHEQERRRG